MASDKECFYSLL